MYIQQQQYNGSNNNDSDGSKSRKRNKRFMAKTIHQLFEPCLAAVAEATTRTKLFLVT